jgi:hypothetical protein
MSAKSFLRDVGGRLKNIFGVVVSAGNANAGDIPALDDTGRLDISTMPVGVTQEVSVVPASEALADGDFVNIWDNGGVAKARKADYSIVGKEACGYVLAGVAQGGNATVFHDSANTHLAGLTNG